MVNVKFVGIVVFKCKNNKLRRLFTAIFKYIANLKELNDE